MILDFTPNAVHTGIYAALARHYDRDAGVNLHVIAPTATTDSIKLLETGKVDFAILDIHDLAIADASAPTHPGIVGIMAIVERPLAAVLAAPGIASPKAFEGKTVGITGVPSDTAVLRSEVIGSGGDPAKVKTITIGYNAVADLLAGRVSGALGFWNDEGVTIRSKQPGYHVFRVDDYGAPSYPELVVCATAETLRRDPGLARGVVQALIRGYDYTLTDPRAGGPGSGSGGPRAGSEARRGPARRAAPGLQGRRRPRRRARQGQPRHVGRVGGSVRDRHPAAGRRHNLRPRVRREPARRLTVGTS